MRALLPLSLLAAAACLTPVPVHEPDGGAAERCSHATCRGCCSEGVCVSGYDDEACGLLGRPCDACPLGRRCSVTRTCELPPRDAGVWAGRVYGSPMGDPVPPQTDRGDGEGGCNWGTCPPR